jgi:hypothetical protein
MPAWVLPCALRRPRDICALECIISDGCGEELLGGNKELGKKYQRSSRKCLCISISISISISILLLLVLLVIVLLRIIIVIGIVILLIIQRSSRKCRA